MNEISRRDFLKTTAIGTLGVASVGVLGGCSSDKSTTDKDDGTKQTKVTHKPVRTETCDMVVVGSGTAGMCAAVRAAELGASVILLEKRSIYGGTSLFAEGVGGFNSFMHKATGMEFDINEAVIKCQEYHHWSADTACLQRYMSESGKTIDWLKNCGAQFLVATTVSGGYPTWHLLSNDKGQSTSVGEGVLKPLYNYSRKIGVNLRVSHPATDLIVENGTVEGVYVNDEKKKEEYAIKAKTVVLATGGYANNKEIFERFTQLDFDSIWNYGQPDGRDGDGITWAKEFGAALHYPDAVMFGVPTVYGIKTHTDKINFLFTHQPNLRINERGLRYMNEDKALDFGITGNTLRAQARAYSLFDQAYLDMFQKQAVIFPDPLNRYPAGTPMSDAYDVINEQIEKGRVKKCASIAELAKVIGCDVNTLQGTLDKYNQACAIGKDLEFFTPAPLLYAVKTPPYYIARLQNTMFTTVGGLRVDEYFRVTNTEGKPIPGLFALGNDASSIYGHDYDVGIMSGSQQGWCATGGRLVAEMVFSK